MTYDSETRTIVIGENNGKKYIQPPRFKVNATLQIAIEQVKEIINLPQNKSKFKDGELILIECIGRDGGKILVPSNIQISGNNVDIIIPEQNDDIEIEIEKLKDRIDAIYNSVQGPTGPQGPTGIAGVLSGFQGSPGPQGPTGPQGGTG